MKSAPIAMALLILCIAGCKKRVDAPSPSAVGGSVFVVTKGQSVIKLPLVTIGLYPWTSSVEILRLRMDQIGQAERDAVREIQAQRERVSKFESLSSEYLALFTSNIDLTIDLKVVLANVDSPVGIRPLNWRAQKAAGLARLELISKANDELTAKMGANNGEVNAAKWQIQKLEQEIKHGANFARMWAGLVYKTAEVKSDIEGRYAITNVPAGDYFVLADSSRQVGDEKELYHWLMPIRLRPGCSNMLDLHSMNQVNSVDDIGVAIEPASIKDPSAK